MTVASVKFFGCLLILLNVGIFSFVSLLSPHVDFIWHRRSLRFFRLQRGVMSFPLCLWLRSSAIPSRVVVCVCDLVDFHFTFAFHSSNERVFVGLVFFCCGFLVVFFLSFFQVCGWKVP